MRRRYQLNDRIILYVGTIEPRKNLPKLIEAFATERRAGRREDLPEAAALAESALGIFDDLGAEPGVGRTLRLLGEIRRRQGLDALGYLRRAVETLRRTDPPDEYALAERTLAAAEADG